MRGLHKTWRNGRGGQWTHRARWYRGPASEPTNIRIRFEGDHRQVDWYYSDEAKAQRDWDDFIAGTLTTKMLSDRWVAGRANVDPVRGV